MMKKITLLLLAFIGFSVNAQILYLDDISTDGSSNYTFLDGDGKTINPFFTDQGVFGNGSWGLVNFGPPLGVAYYSTSFFVGADSCSAASDYMVLPVLDFTNANSSPTLTISAAENIPTSAAPGGKISIYATTSIAGTEPAVSDFTNPAIATYTLTDAYASYSTDLSSLSGSSTVYIAIVSESNGCNSLIAINNIKVKNLEANDIEVKTYSLITDDVYTSDFITNYSVVGCSSGTTSIDVTLKNAGTGVINDTVYVAYVYSTDLGTIVSEDTILDFITTPLASGADFVHTFSEGVDMSQFELTVFNVVAYLNVEEGDSSNNELLHIVVAPNTVDLSSESYTNSFEFDVDFSTDAEMAKTLGVKFENNGVSTGYVIEDWVSIYSDALDYVSDGNSLLVHDYTGNQSSYPASNNWAFTSCMAFDASKFYKVSFDYTTFSGSQAPHNVSFKLTSDYSSTSVVQTVLPNVVFNAEEMTAYSGNFSVNTSGNYHFALHDVSSLGFIMTIDMLTIEELPAPVAPSISSSWNACNNTATLTFNYSANNTYKVDWGDGSALETVTSSPATHVYTPGNSYIATITATNVAGNASNTSTINAVALAAPSANFILNQSTNSISLTATENVPCNTYTWIYGDNTPNGSGLTSNHTYTTGGQYTVTLIVDNPAGSATTSQVVSIGVGISEIDFVNGINVFPNPATDHLNVAFELNSNQDVEITLVSIDGKVVSSTTSNNVSNVSTSINTSNLSTGMYILNVITNEGKFTKNVVIK